MWPAFNAHQRRNLPLLLRRSNFLGSRRQHNFFRMLAHLLAHGRHLRGCPFHSFRPSNFAWYPNRKEYSGKPALFDSRNINAAVGVPNAQIEFRIEKSLRRIVMRVHHDRRKNAVFFAFSETESAARLIASKPPPATMTSPLRTFHRIAIRPRHI